MRIDLCRKCGIEMKVSKRCDVCHEADEFVCPQCGAKSEQFHMSCIMISFDCALLDTRAA